MAWPTHIARGLVPMMAPVLKSLMTSPARPQVTATMPATKKSFTGGVWEMTATMSRTMRPKISIGSMPVWPTDCALMMVVTNDSRMMTTATSGLRLSPRQMTSAAAATMRASTPAS